MTVKEKSPWNIECLYDLQFFNCPSCIYKHNSKQDFICHAYDTHPESVDYLKNIKDGSLSDILCPWDKSEDEEEYSVEKIIDKSFDTYGNISYFIKWKGYDDKDNTWEPIGNLYCQDLIEEFEKKYVPKNIERNGMKKESQIKTELEDPLNSLSENVLAEEKSHQNHLVVEDYAEDQNLDFTENDEEQVKQENSCPLCFIYFFDDNALKDHILIQHSSDGGIIIDDVDDNENKSDPEWNFQDDNENKSDPEWNFQDSNGTKESKRYECDLCVPAKSYTRKSSLKEHMTRVHENKNDIVHDEPKDFQCDYDNCDASYKRKYLLTAHINAVHEGIGHKCDWCGKIFQDNYNLNRHVTCVHEKQRPNVCQFCPKSYANKADLIKHVSAIHQDNGGKFKCEICERLFTKDTNLIEHKKWKHKDEDPSVPKEQFKCALCDKSYPKRVALKNHMHIKHGRGIDKENIKTIPCDKCELLFSTDTALRQHLKWKHETVKTKTENMTCDQCNETFVTPRYLKKHKELVHEGVKRYKCEDCGKMFGQMGNMKLHKARVHEGKKSEKKFKCKLCDKSYYYKQALKDHIAW